MLAVLVAAPLAGFVAVLIASFVPDAWVLDSLVDAVDAGWLTSRQYGPGTTGRTMDYFTDCIGATIGLGDGVDASRLTNAIRSPTLGSCVPTVEALDGYRRGDGLAFSYEYFRYWHGYAVITRPLIAVVGLAATRMIVLWALVVVIVGLARQLARAHGWAVAAALLVPVVVTTDLIDLPRSLPHACGALAALTTTWFAHRRVVASDGGLGVGELAALSIAAGATFLFFDILTIVPGAWALYVGAVMLACSRWRSGRSLLRDGAVAAAGWIVGWVWMWTAKWLLAVLVFGFDDVKDEISTAAGTRLDGEVSYLDLGVTNSIRRTWSAWLDHPLTGVVLILLAVLVASVVGRRAANGTAVWSTDRWLLMLPALIPPVWFELLRNHTQVHVGFTYRSWAMVIGIIAAAVVVSLPDTSLRD